jgi:hypothetical protein
MLILPFSWELKIESRPQLDGLGGQAMTDLHSMLRTRGKSLHHPAVAYDLPIKCPCMRQQSRGFFTAGLSINCACFLKQSCIADSLCAASKAAEDAKATTRVAVVSNAFMADSFGERANV